MFKAVFAKNENVLAKMVADITGIDYEILKDNIILETNELPIHTKNEKVKRCDFILKINNDNIINLELNGYRYAGLLVKNLSYLFQLFATSSKKGEKYNENLVVTQINLNCYKEVNFEDIKPLSRYSLREDETNKLYVKNVTIYELNVVKCHELYYNVDKKEELPNYVKWGALIYSNSMEEISEISRNIISSKERNFVMDKLSKLTREDLFYSEEEALEWAEWERKSILSEAREEGLKEGRQIGLEQGLQEGIEQGIEQGMKKGLEQGIEQNAKEMILSMKDNNASVEFIAKVSNKTIEEINNIIKER